VTARKAAADLKPRGRPRKPKPPPNPNGRPPHEPTAAQRVLVKTLVVAGWNRERIGGALDIDAETLRKYYRVEIDQARASLNLMPGEKTRSHRLAMSAAARARWATVRRGRD